MNSDGKVASAARGWASGPAMRDATAAREAISEADRLGHVDLHGRQLVYPRPAASGSPEPVVAADRELVGLLGRLLGRRQRPAANENRKTGDLLARLSRRDARWRYLQGICVGGNGSHIDHLVIGPGGVYAMSVKYHRHGHVWVRGNIFRVDGAAYAYVSNSRHEALRASRCLSAACGFAVSVTGVVVVIGVEQLAVREAPGDVHVVDRASLRSWFRRRGDVLDGPTVTAIYDAARRSSTWAPPA